MLLELYSQPACSTAGCRLPLTAVCEYLLLYVTTLTETTRDPPSGTFSCTDDVMGRVLDSTSSQQEIAASVRVGVQAWVNSHNAGCGIYGYRKSWLCQEVVDGWYREHERSLGMAALHPCFGTDFNTMHVDTKVRVGSEHWVLSVLHVFSLSPRPFRWPAASPDSSCEWQMNECRFDLILATHKEYIRHIFFRIYLSS